MYLGQRRVKLSIGELHIEVYVVLEMSETQCRIVSRSLCAEIGSIRSAVLIQYRLVTDRQTDTGP